MGVTERDFSNFELGDNVYELASGLIPEMGDIAGVNMGENPDTKAMGQLVGKFGKNKVLRDNETVDISVVEAADLVDRSGVQKPLNRSLWTPEIQSESAGFIVVTGGVANWQDRTADLVSVGISKGLLSPDVQVVTGNREMGKTKSEKENFNVQIFVEEKGVNPTETQYANDFVVPKIREAGGNPVHTFYNTDDGSRLAENFVREINFTSDPDIEKTYFIDGLPVTFARVANAGIQLAVQLRNAVRENLKDDFDGYRLLPEVFVITDKFPVARTEDQVNDPVNYQSPYTALRQVALSAKLLQETIESQ